MHASQFNSENYELLLIKQNAQIATAPDVPLCCHFLAILGLINYCVTSTFKKRHKRFTNISFFYAISQYITSHGLHSTL